ncbi:phosphoethanolamine transferase, partial [Anaerovibrio sp.]|uniref:phosphoethanolamine transferase n=1 Tax=Anaerovibrio sp. TaxID=1872532 RepID=UPI00388F33C5
VAMYMEYNIAQDWIRFKGETLFGHGMLLGLILLRVIAFDWVKNPLGYLLHGLVYVSMWLLPIVQVIHHAIYGEFISIGAIVALQQTDPKESLEWIMTYIKVPVLLLLGIVLLLIGSFPGVYELKIYRKKKSQVQFLRKKSLVIISLIIWSVMVIKLFPMVGVVDQWKEQRILQAEEQRFNDNYEERFAGIQVHPKYNLTKGTYIIVVGESESRDYMKAYNPEYKYNNTPWLSSMAADDNMIIMDKAYACYNLTKIALGTGFTEASQYNDVSFINSMSLLDVAKKRGYKTYWFSNQIGEQFNEVPIHMVARRADSVQISINEYDDGLLPLLSTIDPNENNLIIFHLLGSHARYVCRFPDNERVFEERSNEGDYANSIYFTDRLLRQVFDYAKANLNLQAMLYFSDHGEDYDLGHGPAI